MGAGLLRVGSRSSGRRGPGELSQGAEWAGPIPGTLELSDLAVRGDPPDGARTPAPRLDAADAAAHVAREREGRPSERRRGWGVSPVGAKQPPGAGLEPPAASTARGTAPGVLRGSERGGSSGRPRGVGRLGADALRTGQGAFARPAGR